MVRWTVDWGGKGHRFFVLYRHYELALAGGARRAKSRRSSSQALVAGGRLEAPSGRDPSQLRCTIPYVKLRWASDRGSVDVSMQRASDWARGSSASWAAACNAQAKTAAASLAHSRFGRRWCAIYGCTAGGVVAGRAGSAEGSSGGHNSVECLEAATLRWCRRPSVGQARVAGTLWERASERLLKHADLPDGARPPRAVTCRAGWNIQYQ